MCRLNLTRCLTWSCRSISNQITRISSKQQAGKTAQVKRLKLSMFRSKVGNLPKKMTSKYTIRLRNPQIPIWTRLRPLFMEKRITHRTGLWVPTMPISTPQGRMTKRKWETLQEFCMKLPLHLKMTISLRHLISSKATCLSYQTKLSKWFLLCLSISTCKTKWSCATTLLKRRGLHFAWLRNRALRSRCLSCLTTSMTQTWMT